jgi:hypothetical protein
MAACGGVESPAALPDLDCRPALVGGQRVDPGGVEALDPAVLAGGAHVVVGTGKRG